MIDRLIKEVQSKDMKDKNRSILVRPYAYGQLRIQITDVTRPDSYAPKGHGEIIREMCTYQKETMLEKVDELKNANDAYKKTEEYEKPWNCEGRGSRIRLDNKPKDRIKNE